MGRLVILALILGIASAVFVFVVAQWQVDRSQAQSSSPLASVLIAQATGGSGAPPAPARAPRVSLRWPAITGSAVAVVVLGVGIAFDVTGRE
jgi:hypothetical protein